MSREELAIYIQRPHLLKVQAYKLFCPNNRPFPSSPGPLFQNEGRCQAFNMEMIFHSHANKTHFHEKGCAPSLILKVRVLELGSGPL